MEVYNNEISNNLNTSLTTLSINESPPLRESSPTIEDQSQEPTPSVSSSSTHTTEVIIPIRSIPTHNTPEMIILCLDTCADPEFTAFKLGDGSTYSPLYMLKRTIEIFVQNKNFIDPRHEYALLALDDKSIKWIQGFTNNPREIIKSLSDISECEQNDEFDLSVIFNSIWGNVTIPKPKEDLTIPPPYVVRLILLYSRSFCTPVIKKDFKELLSNPYFTIDVVMTHEESSEDNKFQEIFYSLQQMDEKGYSYNFSVGRNPTLLHDAMAKLLGHPLQRPVQSQACFKAPTDKDD